MPEKLGTGIVIPVCAECREPKDLFEEAEELWAAERNAKNNGSICANWGKVCVLKNSKIDNHGAILQAWQDRIAKLGNTYITPLLKATCEARILDETSGLALFDWPKDADTDEPLQGFDLLLMTATEPILNKGEYPTAKEIAEAWARAGENKVRYFWNNRRCRITTFQDKRIEAALGGEPPE